MDHEAYLEIVLSQFMAEYDISGTKKKAATIKPLNINKVSFKL
jgi:hypothetical protein